MTAPSYKRILLKLSGEVLMGEGGLAIDPVITARVAGEIAGVREQGYELCVVVGGGNIFRGLSAAAKGIERATADYMGMLATVMNALAVQNALEEIGVDTRVQSAIPMASVCEPFIRRRAERHLQKGRVVIFAAGVGSPFFTTDSGAALRAAEMKCDALFKGTSVDGVYDADPKKVADAVRYDTVAFSTVLSNDLKVMDASAIALCRDNDIPIVVFNIREHGNFAAVLAGKGVSTTVSNAPGAMPAGPEQKAPERKAPERKAGKGKRSAGMPIIAGVKKIKAPRKVTLAADLPADLPVDLPRATARGPGKKKKETN